MSNIRYDYLISWFHPTEYAVKMDVPYWVTGQNEDFGFETRCARVRATNPENAMRFVRAHYDLPGFTVTFRFCKQHSGDALPAVSRVNLHPVSMAA